MANGHVAPCLFQKGDDLDTLCLGDTQTPGDARYPLNKVLVTIARQYPEDVFGVLVRGCDERGLYTLYRLNQLEPDKVVPVGIACPEALAKACECKKPFPDDLVAGEKIEGVAQQGVEDMEDLDLSKRFAFWMDQFSKCVKCYGCRNICPMEICRERCITHLDEPHWQSQRIDAKEARFFQLIRVLHLAGRCTECGECERVCPSNIPLAKLMKKSSQIIERLFDYRTGEKIEVRPPLLTFKDVEKNIKEDKLV